MGRGWMRPLSRIFWQSAEKIALSEDVWRNRWKKTMQHACCLVCVGLFEADIGQ